ncbi:MAG: lytic transglycosylase domain-containing protein [Syntrophorhabdus aromaticivorans]|uniref:Lytic transglycosylase domain-containing protein n=1 Tax=Syntrophorhabdus aromaticivorans TaxID=328301 RepID=A0A971M2N9_9BACT|nr:lytic transglycosylase domain-containing protein [Syntrophorhabdus aromaticivorans]
MPVQKRLVLSTASVMVLLCFTFVSVHPTSVAHRERVKKEEIVPQIISHVQDQNVNLEEDELKTIAEMVYDESIKCGVDYRLVLAIMKVESNFKQNAVSEQGARGLLQVKPSLAKYIAPDAGVKWRGDKTLDEPDKNIKIGVHFFSKLVEDFDKNITMALHAYHVGPTRLRTILTEKRSHRNAI